MFEDESDGLASALVVGSGKSCGTRTEMPLREGPMPIAFRQVRIALWRGYVSACFYARPPDADFAIAISPSFRILRLPWEQRVPLHEHPGAVDSLRVLEQKLHDQGWQRIGFPAEHAWYELSFSRSAPTDTAVRSTPQPAGATVSAIHGTVGTSHIPPLRSPTAPNGTADQARPLLENEISREIIAVLQHGPVTTSELCRRVGRSTNATRTARRELEVAGLVRRASPPPGGSTRASYWELVPKHSRGGKSEGGLGADKHPKYVSAGSQKDGSPRPIPALKAADGGEAPSGQEVRDSTGSAEARGPSRVTYHSRRANSTPEQGGR
jgi:hypothetical protein